MRKTFVAALVSAVVFVSCARTSHAPTSVPNPQKLPGTEVGICEPTSFGPTEESCRLDSQEATFYMRCSDGACFLEKVSSYFVSYR